MKLAWWKIATIIILIYVIALGLTGEVPRQAILNETVRNLYFHVTMWFSMVFFLLLSLIHSIGYLRSGKIERDDRAVEFVNTGILFGVIGFVTGALWGKYTWGSAFPKDPKILSAAIAMLAYFAYVILRGAFEDDQKRARISAVYNIFAFVIFNVLIFILPRMTDTLHPGQGGNPGFNIYDNDNVMKPVFYPAIIGWALLGYWVTTLRIRLKAIERNLIES
jgi:heme exporter protein C